MSLLGEMLAVVSLLLFSGNVLVVGPAARRLSPDLGFLLALVANVGLAAVVVLGQYLLDRRPAAGVGRTGAVRGRRSADVLPRSLVLREGGDDDRSHPGQRAADHQPVFAALAAWVLLDEALPPLAVLCGLAILAGLYLTSQRTDQPGSVPSPRGSRSIPLAEIGLALLGAVAYGLGNVARGAGVRDLEAPIVGSLVGATAGLLVCGLLNTDLGKLGGALRGADVTGRRLWLLSGVLTIGAQTCLIAASRYIPVAIAVVISAAVPAVVLPVSVFFLRHTEAVGVRTGIGALFILAGVAGLVLS